MITVRKEFSTTIEAIRELLDRVFPKPYRFGLVLHAIGRKIHLRGDLFEVAVALIPINHEPSC